MLLYCHRRRIWWPILVLISGGATFLLEPLFDHLYGLWFLTEDQWTVIETYGIHVPMWLPIVYVTYYGAWTVWLVTRWQRGASSGEVATLFVGSVLSPRPSRRSTSRSSTSTSTRTASRSTSPTTRSGSPSSTACRRSCASIVYVRLDSAAARLVSLALLGVVPVCFAADSFGTGWLYLAARHSSEDPPMALLTFLARLTVVACFGLVLLAARLAQVERGSRGVRRQRA